MITRVQCNFSEGEIYELDEHSEPLYIWHCGSLEKITPFEYNICVMTDKRDRWLKILEHRTSFL